MTRCQRRAEPAWRSLTIAPVRGFAGRAGWSPEVAGAGAHAKDSVRGERSGVRKVGDVADGREAAGQDRGWASGAGQSQRADLGQDPSGVLTGLPASMIDLQRGDGCPAGEDTLPGSERGSPAPIVEGLENERS